MDFTDTERISILGNLGQNPINIHHSSADYRWYLCGSLNSLLNERKNTKMPWGLSSQMWVNSTGDINFIRQ